MIEVEIRGRLTEGEYEALKNTLAEKGKHLRHLEREMYLLRDYPGYTHSSLDRDTDIRLRNTSGECEIMVKQKAAGNNVGREEISLKLKDNNLDTVRRVVKAMGFKTALKMVRTMDQYDYQGIEWQVVSTTKGLWYYEAERTAHSEAEIPKIHDELAAEARALGLTVMTPEELQEFINTLDKEVNVEVKL